MTRDLQGHKIKHIVTPFEQSYMEKFYINRNKVYQIVRVKEFRKMDGRIVDVTYKNAKNGRIKTISILRSTLEDRKHYYTKRKAYMSMLLRGW